MNSNGCQNNPKAKPSLFLFYYKKAYYKGTYKGFMQNTGKCLRTARNARIDVLGKADYGASIFCYAGITM